MTRQPVTAPGRSSHQPSGFGWRISSRLHLLRPAGAPILLIVPPLGAALVMLASRSDRLYRLIVREDALLEWAQVLAYLVVVATAATAAPRLWRHGDHVAVCGVVGLGLVSLLSIGEELSWGQRLIGFTTPEIASQNRQGELRSQRRADRTIDTSRTPGHRPLRSSGAACRSTSHTAHPAEDTHRVLRGHRRLLRRPAGLSRCAELRRSQVQRMAGDVFLPSTPALVRTHQAPPTGGVPHCCGGRGGRRWRRAGSPALAPTLSPEVDASGRGRA